MKMKLLFLVIVLTGCVAVPKQVIDAMEVQKVELENVRTIYFENMYNQLEAIEKYRIALLDIYEEQYRSQYMKAPGTTEFNGQVVEALVEPTGDKEIDVINIQLLETIETFFKNERALVREDIQNRREAIALAEDNFENIEAVNASVKEYLESLLKVKESRDKLAKSIRSKLEIVSPIPVSFPAIPDPTTPENLSEKLKIN